MKKIFVYNHKTCDWIPISFNDMVELMSRKIDIHPTVEMGDNVKVADGVAIGSYVIIGNNVTIGGETVICSRVKIDFGVEIGERVSIKGKTQIGDCCSIGTDVRIGSNVKIDDEVCLSNGVSVGSYANIDAMAYIGPFCVIAERCRIGKLVALERAVTLYTGVSVETGCKKISCGTTIGYDATISKDTQIVVVNISGSAHSVHWWGTDSLLIGCQQYNLSEWLTSFREIGKRHDYSSDQIDEYKGYIDIIARIRTALIPVEEKFTLTALTVSESLINSPIATIC